MFPKQTKLIFLFAALFANRPVNSALIRPLDVASLTSQADIIVIGQIISVADRGPTTLDVGGGPIPATRFVAWLQVEQVLKGVPQTQTLTLDFAVPEMPIGIQRVFPGQYGLFFITAIQDQLRFTDPMHPSLPAVRNVKLPSGAVLDQVTIVLGQVFEAAQASDSDRITALDALGRLKTDLARDTLHHALNNSSRNIRLDAARTLVARNDVAGLGPVEDALLHPVGLSDYMISNLSGSLAGLRDPLAIPSLSKLIASDNAETRLGAAIALRQSHSGAALIPISHALYDTNDRVRYYAVVGMGEITAQDEWTPAFDEFREHEAKYLSYWRDWAVSNLPRDTRK